MATSASDKLKAMLAKKLNQAKVADNENKTENKEIQSQIPAVIESNSKESKILLVDKDPHATTAKSTELVIPGTNEVAEIPLEQKTSLAETQVSAKTPEKKANSFFENPVHQMMRDLEAALENKLPNMPTILRDIHLHLQKDVDCVTILEDAEIGTIVRGLESIQGQTIVTNPKTGKSTGGKRAPIVASML